MTAHNKRDTWMVVDKRGKIYEKARGKAYLIFALPRIKKEFFRRDLKIVKNGK